VIPAAEEKTTTTDAGVAYLSFIAIRRRAEYKKVSPILAENPHSTPVVELVTSCRRIASFLLHLEVKESPHNELKATIAAVLLPTLLLQN